MPSRIGKHDPATIVGVQNCCPERHHLALSPTAIRYVDIEVELLWVCRVRPLGRVEVISPLERQDRPVLDVQRHEGLARGPPRIRPVHLATQQSAIELGQLKRVRAVEDKALNASDHDVMMAHERPTRCDGHRCGTSFRRRASRHSSGPDLTPGLADSR